MGFNLLACSQVNAFPQKPEMSKPWFDQNPDTVR